MKKKPKHIDDEQPAGDDMDRMVALSIYGNIHNKSWFIKESKVRIPHYYGPRFSTNLADAMEALRFYLMHCGHFVQSYTLLEQMEKGPYSATAELRHSGNGTFGGGPLYTRSWAPTLPLAISRMLLKAPKKPV